MVSVSLSLLPKQFSNPAGVPMAQQARVRTTLRVHENVDTNGTQNLCCMSFPPFVLPSPVSFHSVPAPHSAEMPSIPSSKRCLCWEQPAPEHWLFSKLAAVHLVTVAEEYISASHFLVTMPAICLPFLEGCARRQNSLNRSSISLEVCRMDVECPHSFKSYCTKPLLTSLCSLIVV